MTSIGVLCGPETSSYKVDGNELITMAGTYTFKELVYSDKFDPATWSACGTIILLRSESGANPAVESLCEAAPNRLENCLAAELVKSTSAAAPDSRDPDRRISPNLAATEALLTVCDVTSNELRFSNGRYMAPSSPLLGLSEACAKLMKPMASGLRVSDLNSGHKIMEVCGINHLSHASALLKAMFGSADYLPYRDDALSKLLWSSLCQKQKLTVIACLHTSAMDAQQPALEFCSLVSQVSAAKPRRYALAGSGPASSTELKSDVTTNLNELLSLYITELQCEQVLEARKITDVQKHAERAQAELRSTKSDEIEALGREIKLLEVQVSILAVEPAPKARDSWFRNELSRKQLLLAELKTEETKLSNQIASAKHFEVAEPFRGLIRQSEFNLESLRLRRQALRLKHAV